jgi:hypothetical protein
MEQFLSAKYLSGRNANIKAGIIGFTTDTKVVEAVGRVGIGSTIFEPNADLDVRGSAFIRDTLIVSGVDILSAVGGVGSFGQIYVTGVSTFAGAIDANGDLDVDGHTELDDLNVSGVSTFAGIADFNGDIDVDGHTELDDLNVSGVSTFGSTVDINGSLNVLLDTDVVNLGVAGTAIFTYAIDATGGGLIDGVQIGISSSNEIDTFAGNLTLDSAGGLVEIDDNLLVTGLATVTNSITANLFDSSNLNLQAPTIGDYSGERLRLFDFNNPANTNYAIGAETNHIWFGVDNYGDTQGFKWYGETTQVMRLGGTGNLTLEGNLRLNANTIQSGTGTTVISLVNTNVELASPGGITTTLGDLYVGGDLYVKDDIVFDEFSARNANLSGNLNVSGIGTIATLDVTTGTIDFLSGTNISYSGIGTIETLDVTTGTIDFLSNTNLNTSGIGTIETLDTTTGTIDFLEGTNISYSGIGTIETLDTTTGTIDFLSNTNLNTSGIGTIETLVSSNVNATQLSVSGVSTFSDDVNILNTVTINSSGINAGLSSITALEFRGDLTGNAGSATTLQNPRNFSITGDIVASSVSFDGSGDVVLDTTIQPDSVELGTDTTGDYVRDISGTANQITVTGGTGEGSTPTLSLPTNLVVPQDLTVTRDLQVNRNLNVTGNVTIGGTSAKIFATELTISDPDIVLGYRTDAFGNDVSNDNTANHGGIGLASTEGTPLVDLFIAGIETNPTTYKKIMWFKEGTFAGLGTDAWLINYAVGIGSTQFPTGTRLAAGSVQFTENDLAVVRNINASGIITAPQFIGTASTASFATTAFTLNGVAEFDLQVAYARNAGISTNVIGGIASVTQLAVSGITTLGNVEASQIYVSGVTTSIGGFVGDLTGTATTATNLSDGANITTGTISDDRLPDLITSNINISSGISTLSQLVVGSSVTVTSSGIDASSGIITALQFIGTASTASFATTAFTLNGISEEDLEVAYARNAGIATNVIGGIASVTQLTVSGVSTLSSVQASQIYVSGVTTSIGGFVGNLTGTATTATNLSDGANITTGTIDSARLTGTYDIDISGNAATSDVSTNVIGGIASVTQLSVSGVSTLGVVTADNIYSTGIVTALTFVGNLTGTASTASFAATAFTLNGTAEGSLSVGFATNLKGGIAGNVPYQSAPDTTTFVTNGTSGQVLLFNGSVPIWGNVSAASGAFGGITVYDEGNLVGTSGSITALDFVGLNLLVTGTSGANGIATVTMSDSLVGTGLSISGISTFSDVVSVGSAITFYPSTGIVSATAFYGSGVNLTDLLLGKIEGLQIQEEGSDVGIGYTFATLNFIGDYVTATGVGTVANITFTTPPYADSAGIATYAASSGISTYAETAGIATYAASSGISTSVIGGIASVTSLSVSGISTLGTVQISSGIVTATSGVVTYYGDGSKLTGTGIAISTNTTNQNQFLTYSVSTGSTSGLGITASGLVFNPSTTRLGIGTTNPQANLHVVDEFLVAAGSATTQHITQRAYELENGSLSWEGTAGQLFSITNNLTSGSIFSVNDVSGIPSIDVDADGTIQLAPYADGNVGIATTLPTSRLHVVGDVLVTGVVTASSFSGNVTYATTAGIATYAETAGIATYATTAGIATYATTAGIATYAETAGIATYAASSGISTYAETAGIATYATTAGIATDVIGGIASVTSLSVSGISTLGTVEISSGIVTATSGIITYYGDGSQLDGIQGGSSISTVTSNQAQYIPYATSFGSTTGLGATTLLVYNPSTSSLGIGTTNPQTNLYVVGDGFFTGIVTAFDFNSASDAKLKTNIQPIENPLEKVTQIQGVSFNWIKDNKPSMGVIADEVQKVLPELVSDTDPKTVNYNGLIGLLIECVKQQQEEINILKQSINNNK